jgi:hypothetical protein
MGGGFMVSPQGIIQAGPAGAGVPGMGGLVPGPMAAGALDSFMLPQQQPGAHGVGSAPMLLAAGGGGGPAAAAAAMMAAGAGAPAPAGLAGPIGYWGGGVQPLAGGTPMPQMPPGAAGTGARLVFGGFSQCTAALGDFSGIQMQLQQQPHQQHLLMPQAVPQAAPQQAPQQLQLAALAAPQRQPQHAQQPPPAQ